MNDFWSLDLVENTWTWLDGDMQVDVLTKYGTKGQAFSSSESYPGSRAGHSMAMDSVNQVIHLFGGVGFTNSTKLGNS